MAHHLLLDVLLTRRKRWQHVYTDAGDYVASFKTASEVFAWMIDNDIREIDVLVRGEPARLRLDPIPPEE